MMMMYDALRVLKEAVKEKPRMAAPRLMLAGLAKARGNRLEAREHYTKALPMVKKGVEKERVLREILTAMMHAG